MEACRTLKAGPLHPLSGKSPKAAKCRGRQIKSSTCVFNYVNNQPGRKGVGERAPNTHATALIEGDNSKLSKWLFPQNIFFYFILKYKYTVNHITI